MKKLVSVLLVLTLLLAFAACGSTNDESSSSAPQQTSASNSAPAEESSRTNDSSASGEGAGGSNSSFTPAETGANALVVYFSWSGNTENVAKAIQSLFRAKRIPTFLKSYPPRRTAMITIPFWMWRGRNSAATPAPPFPAASKTSSSTT